MEIEFDPEKAASNLRAHRVSFAHAEQALRNTLGITIEDPGQEGEPRFVTLGADSLGRVLVVVHTPRENRVRIISARKASPNEARGIGYQTAIKEAFRAALSDENVPLTAGKLREILRQELHHAD